MNEEVFDLVLGNVLTAWGWGTPDTPLSTIPCSCHHSLSFTCHRLLYSLQLGTTLGRSEGRVRASRNSYSLFLCQIGGFLRNGSLGSPESMGLLCANALSLSRTWRLGLMGHVYTRRWQWTDTGWLFTEMSKAAGTQEVGQKSDKGLQSLCGTAFC